MSPALSLTQLQLRQSECRHCPELRRYCAEVAAAPRAAYRHWAYWGRPVPGFGDPRARILIVGLAPAAHGANRTGRMFTGDRSGDFLYAALHRAGLASQPTSVSREDGLVLRGVYIGAALRCAPPANRPTPAQLERCRPWLVAELDLLRPRAILALGAIGWNAVLAGLADGGVPIPRPRPRFGHGVEVSLPAPAGWRRAPVLLGSYHVSQQNTFTGRLTPAMLDAVLARVLHVVGTRAGA